MERIRLGKTEMMVSRLGIGSIPIQRIPEDEVVVVIRRCLELGTKFCRRYNYCQPCTQGISISSVMTFPSRPKRQSPERLYSERSAKEMGKTANCIECGECEERCPYKLPIRKMIAEYVNLYKTERKKYLDRLDAFMKG